MKYRVTIILTPGESERSFVEEYEDQDQAVKFAQSAACHAYARSFPDGTAVFYPAHRIDHVRLETLK